MPVRTYMYFDRPKMENILLSVQKDLSIEKYSVDELKKLDDASIYEKLEGIYKKQADLITMLPLTSPLETKLDLDNFIVTIKKGNLIILSGSVRLSLLDRIIVTLTKWGSTMAGVSPDMERSILRISSLFGKFVNMRITTPNPKQVTIFGRINKDSLKCELEEFYGELVIFGRIKRVFQKDERIQIYDSLGNFEIPDKEVESLLSGLAKEPSINKVIGLKKTPKIDDFTIKYPAMEIEPVVMYW